MNALSFSQAGLLREKSYPGKAVYLKKALTLAKLFT